jgi:hypothetical protein
MTTGTGPNARRPVTPTGSCGTSEPVLVLNGERGLPQSIPPTGSPGSSPPPAA